MSRKKLHIKGAPEHKGHVGRKHKGRKHGGKKSYKR